MVCKGDPKSFKNRWKSSLGPSRVPLCASVTHLIAKWCQNGAQGPPRWPKNGHLGTIKGAKNSTTSNNQVYNKEIYIFHFLIDFNPGNKFFYSCQSFSLQIRRPLIARGHQAGRQAALSQRSMLFLSFIDVIFQESFQHSISNCYLMVNRSANWCLIV